MWIKGEEYDLVKVVWNPLSPFGIEMVVKDEWGKTMKIDLETFELSQIFRAMPHPYGKVMEIRYEKKRQKTSVRSSK